MSVRVHLGAGTGVELLVAAAAVADPAWREVFHRGATAYDAALAAGGDALVADVSRFGRYGWINLLGPLTARRGAWSVPALRRVVAEADPQELVLVLAGARRRQLRTRLDDATIAAGVAGDPAARRAWRAALDDTLLTVSPWLVDTDPAVVRSTLLDVVERLPHTTRAAPLRPARDRLETVGPDAMVATVAPGVTYRAGLLDEVVLVTSPATAPILVVVDEVGRTVILHPPLVDGEPDDAGARLRDLGRAVGDDTRIRILQTLRVAASSLADLCEALGSPRTTLLHHLALLRAAGLVSIEVIDGRANVYRLRPEGFAVMADAASAFPRT